MRGRAQSRDHARLKQECPRVRITFVVKRQNCKGDSHVHKEPVNWMLVGVRDLTIHTSARNLNRQIRFKSPDGTTRGRIIREGTDEAFVCPYCATAWRDFGGHKPDVVDQLRRRWRRRRV